MPSAILIHPGVWPQQTWAENWEGALPPFWEGRAGSPSNPMSSGPRPTSVPSGILTHAAIWPQQTWAKNGGLCPLFGRGLPSNTVSWAEAYLHTKWHLDASSRLATTEMGRKLGRGLCPLLERGRGPYLTQSRLGQGLPPYQVAS